jgi:hypothetical protein
MSLIIKGRKGYFNYNLDNEIGRGELVSLLKSREYTYRTILGIRR